jgi:hypothetical protein
LKRFFSPKIWIILAGLILGCGVSIEKKGGDYYLTISKS